MRLNAKGQLGVGERCIEADAQGIKLVFCRLGTVDGPWEYDEVTWRSTQLFKIRMCLTEHKKVQKFDSRVPGSLSWFPRMVSYVMHLNVNLEFQHF